MNSSIPAFRLALFALTGAMIIGTVSLRTGLAKTSTTDALPADSIRSPLAGGANDPAMPTLPTVSVRPSADEIAAADAATDANIPILATIPVRPSEEEIIAAHIDPSDRIQIFSPITVYPAAEDAALLQAQPLLTNTSATSDEDSDSGFGAVFTDAVAEPHRLRLDMPYYSFGKVLGRTHAK